MRKVAWNDSREELEKILFILGDLESDYQSFLRLYEDEDSKGLTFYLSTEERVEKKREPIYVSRNLEKIEAFLEGIAFGWSGV
jgi:hypothetical protein